MRFFHRFLDNPAWKSGFKTDFNKLRNRGQGATRPGLVSVFLCLIILAAQLLQAYKAGSAQTPSARQPPARASNPLSTQPSDPQRLHLPPRVLQARRFLGRRGWKPGSFTARALLRAHIGHSASPASAPESTSTATWQPVGPTAVLTPTYGLITGRVSALALDPADSTGNHLFIGTTGGGVWVAQNVAVTNSAQVVFTPLTDNLEALSGAQDASISIGALTVQPGGTGVILAGTGDPNDALDSYYGSGILRSADGGNSWSLIFQTADKLFTFEGEGFAGFAWSTANPQLVVAAVSQAYEGTLVNAQIQNHSFEGLYYSTDAGATWTLGTISDGPDEVIQGPLSPFDYPDGNAATSVVWNPVRKLFIAAVRFHGYYQSADGITFTRMAAQPGVSLTTLACPTLPGEFGSIDCPIFRGTLAVNPLTGDTFAWTVDLYNQDVGLWQDQCSISKGVCTNQNVTFARQWNTLALESNTANGAATIENGDYSLTLASVPAALGQGEDTWLLAGANDLWKCSLAEGCVWRNTTNAATCISAQVAPFQHALAWSATNPLEILIGNDSGLWRSLDAIGETGSVCAPTDASHFQNLNGSLGSLAEVESLAVNINSQFNMIAGLGVNGTSGLKSATAVTADWPQGLGGDGGPVAIDPINSENWYVNAQNGVSIYLCSAPESCSPASFGDNPVVNDADVDGDGDAMPSPAPFLVDPLDTSQLLVGTCRVWRGSANGAGWRVATDAISPILDSGALNASCSGDALIRSMAAMPISGGAEVVYVGLYGSMNGGQSLPGHIFSATINPQNTTMPVWHDLTLNPVTNSPTTFNQNGLDLSSIFVDTHDPTGMTVYATVEGFRNASLAVKTIYGSTDGGLHWSNLTANLPEVPVSSVVVDPQNAGTVYLATDIGVYFTTQIASCANLPSFCWSQFGTGLPEAPVEQLSASSASASVQMLTAGTYGRGIWQTPLWSAGTTITTASPTPDSLTFAAQVFGTTSGALPVTLTNTGNVSMTTTAVLLNGDFAETDNCQNVVLAPAATCIIQVTFTPTATGTRTGQMTISANLYGGQLTVALSGTGTAAGIVSLTPATISFDPAPGQSSTSPPVLVGTTSDLFPVAVQNSAGTPNPLTSISITPPFFIVSNSCGVTSLEADTDCQMQLAFTPTQEGSAAGTLTIVDGAGTQTVLLTGFGYAPPTDIVNPDSISFPGTALGQLSVTMPVLFTNTGDLPLTSIAASVSTGFQTSNNCGTQLPGHAACTFQVIFAPNQLGVQTGLLTVSDALRTQTVSLSGTGLQPAALTASPASLTFSSQLVGVPGNPGILTITNSGGVPATQVGFQITGASAGSFATGITTCPASLSAGGSCTVQVIFSPMAAGASSATLIVSSATAGVTPISVPLNGAAQVTSGLNVNPAKLTFPAVIVGSSSAAQTVTLSNTSSSSANQLALSITAEFALTQNNCTVTLLPGSSCTVGVVFTPTGTGPVSGTLNVSSPSIITGATVNLSGTGAVVAALQITPPSIDFHIIGVGQTSTPSTVTITNTGTEVALTSLALSVPTGFQLVSNTCAATLAPGASCTTGVEFVPTAAGEQSGNLTATSATISTNASVVLKGMGFDFTLAISGSGSQSVSNGQSTVFTIVLTPLSGSSGVFTFACGTLPSDALCIFSPTTETLNAGVAGNESVTVSTGNSASSALSKGPRIWRAIPLICGLLLLPIGWKRRSKRMHGIVLLALLMIFAASIASCTSSGGGTGGSGGSGGGSGGSGTTPSGTYSIPVNVTSNGVEHSITVTLTVD